MKKKEGDKEEIREGVEKRECRSKEEESGEDRGQDKEREREGDSTHC